jgi:hypothetical protein
MEILFFVTYRWFGDKIWDGASRGVWDFWGPDWIEALVRASRRTKSAREECRYVGIYGLCAACVL